jgi:hypothetical protein
VDVGSAKAVACSFAVVWLVLVTSPAVADAQVTAAVTPAQVALSPGRSATVLLSVANPTQAPVSVKVRAVAAEGSVSASPATATIALEPGQSRTESFTLTRTAEGSGQDVALSFVVDSPDASVVAGTTVKAIANAPPVTAAVEAGPDRVNEKRPGSATLVIGTDREGPVRVTSLSMVPPQGTRLEVTCPGGSRVEWREGGSDDSGCGFDVAPRSKVALPVRVHTEGPTVPGTRSAVIRVAAVEAGRAETASTLVLTMPITLEVYGEADILSGLGVPVFLVVPGVIVVLVARFLVRRFSPLRHRADQSEPEPVVTTATGTALLGVLVSLGMAVLYPLLTEWLWPGTALDYTRHYSFFDLYLVFGYSVAVGVAVWLLLVTVLGVRAAWTTNRVPGPGDAPGALLWKLAFRRTAFPLVDVNGRGGVLLRRTGTGEDLVAPRIVVSAAAGSPLRAQVEELVARGRPTRLWWVVRRAKAVLAYRSDDVAEVCLTSEATIRTITADAVTLAPVD